MIIGAQSHKEAKLYVQDDIGFNANLDPEVITGIHARIAKSVTQPGQSNLVTGVMGESIFFGSDINVGGHFTGRDANIWNFGVVGMATSDQLNGWGLNARNIGVWGEATGSNAANIAGYFNGGIVTMGMIFPSDEQLKDSIQSMNDCLATIMQLSPKNYQYRTDDFALQLPEGEQSGFIAQELEEVLPELVVDVVHPEVRNEEGEIVHNELEYKGINYIGLIPILTQGIKEQQAQITSLEERIATLEALVVPGGMQGSNDKDGKSIDSNGYIRYELYQNRPNPFDETTEIVWRMSEDAKAQIIVHDAQGKMVAILMEGMSSQGLHSLEWNASDLMPGTYYYSLEVNGELMVKRAVKIAR